MSAELRGKIPIPSCAGTLQVVGFYDTGQIWIQKVRTAANFGTASNRNCYWLSGAGIGLQYSFAQRFSVRASWAHVIGDNPGRNLAGDNSDGTQDSSRFWLQSIAYF